MNRILLAMATVGLAFGAQAQDPILDQDFQGFENNGEINFVEEPDDAEAEDWISFDADNLADGSGGTTPRPGNWYGSLDFKHIPEDPVGEDTNFVMISSSWMEGFAPGNRNYLITPELEIEDNMVLRFKAAPRQTPRYSDGLSVLISPDASIGDLESDFSTYLWRMAQMVEDAGWVADAYPGEDYTGCSAGGGLDVASYCWFPSTFGNGADGTTGYLHANNFSEDQYLLENDNAWIGLLEEQTIDLSAYSGNTVRIAFLHDADDDNLVMVDDIVVEVASSVEEFSFAELVSFFPNPATERLSLNFTTLVKNNAIVNVFDAQGKLVMSENFTGANLHSFHTLDINALEGGIYNLNVTIDNKYVVTESFVKQ